MSNKLPDEKRDPLDRILLAWKAENTLPPRFTEGVWRRIREAERAPGAAVAWRQGLAWTRQMMARPLGASVYLSALILAGIGLGYASSERYVHRTEAAWRTAYVQAVSPDPGLHP